jgi:F0F1-type ATP synthase membrane subunit c/vacuolar-type H+-ATPase subunit K
MTNSSGHGAGLTSGSTWRQQRQTYFIIFFALLMSVGIYVLLGFILSQSRKPLPAPAEPLRLVFHVLAAGALVAAVAWMQFRTGNRVRDLAEVGTFSTRTGTIRTATTPPRNVMTPGEFQTETIIALAIAEVCVILGLTYFFMGAPLVAFLPFAAGTLAVDLLGILPKALTYWRALERTQNQVESPLTR